MTIHPASRWLAVLALTLGTAAVPGRAQTAADGAAAANPPIPLETFFARRDAASLRLSPSGRWLAVLVQGTGQRNALAVIDIDKPVASQAIVRFSDVDIGPPSWVGDDHLVFSVEDRQAGSGDEWLAPGLFSVHRDGTGLRELVKLRGNAFFTEPTVGPDRRLSFNHELLHVPRGNGTEVIVGQLNFTGWGNDIDSVVLKRLDVRTGRVRGISQGQPDKARGFLFDPDGEPRLTLTIRDGRRSMHWRGPGQPAWTLLDERGVFDAGWQPEAVDAAGTLYVTVPSGPGATQVLTRLDTRSGQPVPEPLVSVPGFDFDGRLIHDPDTGRALGVRVSADAETTVWFDARLKAWQAEVDRLLPGRVNRVTCRRCAGDERVLLVESWSDQDPGGYYVWRGAAARLERLGSAMKNVEPRRMATLDFHRFAARDGRSVPVWVTQPRPVKDAPPRPAVVLVHGGPWVRGGDWHWDAMPQFLASRGYVVIEPEYRGSTGYGGDHFKAGWRQWGQAMQDDVADAVLWAAQQKLIDPARVCIAGASYGGYATLMGLVRHPELYRCGAAWLAVTEPLRLLERSAWWDDDVGEETRKHSLPTLLGDPKADAAMLKAISPVQQAARIQAPVLLAYGELDRRVPLVHGRDMRGALTAAGRPPEWIVYPGEGHGWRKLENQHDFARRLEAFLARHLK